MTIMDEVLNFKKILEVFSSAQSCYVTRERPLKEDWKAIQINYIDSYDYKVVVNIKIILQSFKKRRSKRAKNERKTT